jgi:exodeoxyribonuclease-3
MSGVRVVSLNVNGVRAAVRKGLPALLDALAPDVVCLQEVRAAPQQVPELVAGMCASWHPAERKGYSGVGTLTRMPPRGVKVGIGDAAFDAEGRVLLTELQEVTVLNVYAPSGTTGEVRQAVKMAFLDRFLGFVAELLAQGKPLLVCGDMNIAHREVDLKNWRSNQKSSGFLPEERAWFSRLLDVGLVDVVRRLAGDDTPVYSWWTQRAGARERNVGWRIDYQLATPDVAARALAFDVPRLPVLSDHAPVVVDYEL